jgi:hypothetical protein
MQIFEHKIELMTDAKPIKQRQYRMNQNYALNVREDLDKLVDARVIYVIETTYWWLSPLVIVPKKNGKLKFM